MADSQMARITDGQKSEGQKSEGIRRPEVQSQDGQKSEVLVLVARCPNGQKFGSLDDQKSRQLKSRRLEVQKPEVRRP